MLIGLGGGSCLDLAKLVSLLLSHPGPLSQYYGEFKVPGPVRPSVAIPTTAGTGSEVTPVAVLADPERMMKVGVAVQN
nr:iron-containing alcohol dehydrogenase [Mesorhizobium sp.]